MMWTFPYYNINFFYIDEVVAYNLKYGDYLKFEIKIVLLVNFLRMNMELILW